MSSILLRADEPSSQSLPQKKQASLKSSQRARMKELGRLSSQKFWESSRKSMDRRYPNVPAKPLTPLPNWILPLGSTNSTRIPIKAWCGFQSRPPNIYVSSEWTDLGFLRLYHEWPTSPSTLGLTNRSPTGRNKTRRASFVNAIGPPKAMSSKYEAYQDGRASPSIRRKKSITTSSGHSQVRHGKRDTCLQTCKVVARLTIVCHSTMQYIYIYILESSIVVRFTVSIETRGKDLYGTLGSLLLNLSREG